MKKRDKVKKSEKRKKHDDKISKIQIETFENYRNGYISKN